MDILDILLDILLKPPQPFIGLFLLFVCVNYWLTARRDVVVLADVTYG